MIEVVIFRIQQWRMLRGRGRCYHHRRIRRDGCRERNYNRREERKSSERTLGRGISQRELEKENSGVREERARQREDHRRIGGERTWERKGLWRSDTGTWERKLRERELRKKMDRDVVFANMKVRRNLGE